MASSAERIAGIDEAGRGPWAGPVVAAAVILPADVNLPGLTDSKRLSAKQRGALEVAIRVQAVAWAVAEVSAQQIDEMNILQATFLAMQKACDALAVRPDACQVDGNRAPVLSVPVTTVVGGDALVACISAASILAKVHRDRLMLERDAQYPGYGFSQHKGYGTAQHRQALQMLGPCPEHRKSFKPVRDRCRSL